MFKKPFNAIELDKPKDDTGKKVIINSIGGAIQNTIGTVLYGPYKYWYISQTTNPNNTKLMPKKFITEPYWCVKLKGYNLDIHFTEKELKFI